MLRYVIRTGLWKEFRMPSIGQSPCLVSLSGFFFRTFGHILSLLLQVLYVDLRAITYQINRAFSLIDNVTTAGLGRTGYSSTKSIVPWARVSVVSISFFLHENNAKNNACRELVVIACRVSVLPAQQLQPPPPLSIRFLPRC